MLRSHLAAPKNLQTAGKPRRPLRPSFLIVMEDREHLQGRIEAGVGFHPADTVRFFLCIILAEGPARLRAYRGRNNNNNI